MIGEHLAVRVWGTDRPSTWRSKTALAAVDIRCRAAVPGLVRGSCRVSSLLQRPVGRRGGTCLGSPAPPAVPRAASRDGPRCTQPPDQARLPPAAIPSSVGPDRPSSDKPIDSARTSAVVVSRPRHGHSSVISSNGHGHSSVHSSERAWSLVSS